VSDRRGLKRRHLIYYLEVSDVATGSVVGHVVDLTTGGMLLTSPTPIETGKVFALRMALPAHGDTPAEAVEFSARSLWCQDDINPDLLLTGFRFLEPTPHQVVTFTNVIDDYAFDS
jgi:hypothetical protein